MAKLVVHSYVLSEKAARAILKLKESNGFLFKITVEFVVIFSKARLFIMQIRKVMLIWKKEGGKRPLNRLMLALRDLAV
jgi:Tat protein secretion system quality control protein TatD with DNase activity